MDGGRIRVKKNYFKASESLKLSEDFQIHKNHLSPVIQIEAMKRLHRLKEEAEKFGPIDEYACIATAVLRDAIQLDEKNTKVFLKKLKDELNLVVNVISQEEEARIGYRTGISKAGLDPAGVAAVWDSGNRSFQLADEENIYEGKLGNSLVQHLIVEEIQKKKFGQDVSANPMSLSEALMLRTKIQANLTEAPAWLKNKLIKNSRVLGLGDPDSIFNYASIATQKTLLKREEIWSAIQKLAPLSASELRKVGYGDAERAVPLLIFLNSVMEHLGINEVDFVPTTSNTEGVFLSPKLWKSWSNY